MAGVVCGPKRRNLGIVKATIQANEKQKFRLTERIKKELQPLRSKTLGILGLSFKNNTDDMREAPSITILKELSSCGARFRVYDPKAMKKAASCFQDLDIHIIKYCDGSDTSPSAAHRACLCKPCCTLSTDAKFKGG